MTSIAPTPSAATPTGPVSRRTNPADWTEEASLVQPRQAAFWLFAVLLLIGSISFVQEQLAFADASTTAWLMGLVLLALYAVPVYLLVNAVDLFEREPRSLLLGAFLWGAVVATFLAGRINGEWGSIIQKLFGAAFAREWSAALVGPGVEELIKFLGVLVIYLIARHEFDDVLDGFVYGALVGLGFTVAEDMYYFFAHFVGQAGASDLGGLFEGFFIRIIVGGPYSHVLMTGLSGMGLAYYVTRSDLSRLRRVLVAFGLYAAAVAAHFVWNSPLFEDLLGTDPGPTDWIVYAAVKGLPFLVLLVVLVRIAMRRERRWVHESLRDEMAAGLVTAEELASLDDLRARRTARKAVGLRKGVRGERLLARLQHAQIALALANAGSAPGGTAPAGTAPAGAARLAAGRSLIAGLRSQLDALPDVAPATGAASATAFRPTHRVPPEGLLSWAAPDPGGPGTPLGAGLELELVQRVADWARVRAANGWTGWVDARRLVPRQEAAIDRHAEPTATALNGTKVP